MVVYNFNSRTQDSNTDRSLWVWSHIEQILVLKQGGWREKEGKKKREIKGKGKNKKREEIKKCR